MGLTVPNKNETVAKACTPFGRKITKAQKEKH